MSTRPQHVYKAMLEFSNSCGVVCVCVCVYVCVKERATNDAFLWCTCWECVVNVNACGLGGCVFVWDRFVVVINNKEEVACFELCKMPKICHILLFVCLFVCLAQPSPASTPTRSPVCQSPYARSPFKSPSSSSRENYYDRSASHLKQTQTHELALTVLDNVNHTARYNSLRVI